METKTQRCRRSLRRLHSCSDEPRRRNTEPNLAASVDAPTRVSSRCCVWHGAALSSQVVRKGRRQAAMAHEPKFTSFHGS
jgi:hypothetical protein